MIPFYVIFAILAAASFCETLNLNVRQRKVVLFFLLIALVLFAGCRYQIGANDFEEYTRSYADVVKNGLNYSKYSSSAAIFEPGFVVTYFVCSFISPSPIWALCFIAFLGVGINILCYKQYSPRFFLFAVLFYFVHTYLLREMSLIRSGVAAAICLYSLRYVAKGLFNKFMLTLVIAMSFHLAAIVFVIVYPFYRFNWTPKTWGYIVVICLVSSYVFSAGMLLNALPKIGILARLSNYSWMIGSSKLGILTNPTVLKQLFFVGISLFFYRQLDQKVPMFRVLLTPYILSVCWLMVWNDFAIMGGRMATFLTVTEVLIIPQSLLLVKRSSQPIVASVLISLAFMILYLNGNYYMSDVPGLLPYRFAPFEQFI